MGIGIGEIAGVLPHSRWSGRVWWIVAFAMCVVTLTRRLATRECFELLHPRHISELALELKRLPLSGFGKPSASAGASPWSSVPVSQTSRGLRLSAGHFDRGGLALRHYAISRTDPVLASRCAYLLARYIAHLRHDSAAFELFQGNHGVVHILFPNPQSKTWGGAMR